ncbi:TonB-dependent receptor [uncultured Lacinutrix sp.]|uniref:TonB-dependent receptor domain-containing protein n=1 Tax=uncultured Lacinutrix sp. TaxID=574032 RepID=UPI0026062B2E|nr:TonB-dependent receptor [uncultured Lacinutrix sp.]
MKLKRLLFFFLFWSLVITAQEKKLLTYTNLPLNEVLLDLENQFNVKFSFDSQLLKGKSFSLKKKTNALEDVISEIEIQHNLKFNKASERYYTINKIEPSIANYQDLEEVILTEYLTAGIKKQKDGSIKVSPKNLGILPGLTEPDVLQSLQLIPGINSPNETATGLYVRGGTPDQNLVLWDGIKLYNTSHFFGTISVFNPYIINDVKLFTGGTKAKYGNSISSVIDISSQDKVPTKTKAGFGFNMTHADLYLKTSISNKLGIIVSTRRSYTNLINTFTFQNLSDRVFQNTKISEGNTFFESDPIKVTKDNFKFSDVTAKIIYKLSDKDEIVLSSLLTSNELDYEFLNEEFQDISTDKLNVKNSGVSFKWKHQYNDSFSQYLQAYNSQLDLNYLGTNDFVIDNIDNRFTKKNAVNEYGISLHNDWDMDSKNNLNFGYKLSTNDVSYSFEYLFKNENLDGGRFYLKLYDDNVNINNAIYTEYQHKEKDKWAVNIGIRGNYASLLEVFYVEPRLYYEKFLNSNFKIKASAEQLHQTVSQIEELLSVNFGIESDIWVLSDGNLTPLLKSQQASIGANYNKNGWNLDFDVYAKKVTGISSFKSGFRAFISNGEGEVLGLDILLKKKINNYRTWLSYSLMKNDYTFRAIDNGEPFPANFHIVNQFNWSHTYQWNKFDFSLGFNFRTGIPYTKALGLDDNSFIVYDKTNGDRLPDYHRLDFSSTYNFNISRNEKWKGKLGLSLFNLYNKTNVLNRTYRTKLTSDGEQVLREIERKSLGITPNIVFRVNF